MKNQEHPLSWNAIFRVVITVLGVMLVWKLESVIVLILVSLMLAAAMYPIVRWLNKWIPLTVASILVILALLMPIVLIAMTIVPNLMQQFPDIVRAVNHALQSTSWIPENLKTIDLTQYANNAGSYLIKSTSVITNALTNFLAVIFLTLYFLIDSKHLLQLILWLIPDEIEPKVIKFTEELATINGQYIRGNLLISLVCGIFIYIGLRALGVPYAAPLALFAALTDLLPLIGAYLGALPAIIIGFTISPTVGILVLALFTVYQQFENNIIAPSVYKKALDLSPALSFIAVIIGASLFGMVGAFTALPIAASIPTIIRYFGQKTDKHHLFVS